MSATFLLPPAPASPAQLRGYLLTLATYMADHPLHAVDEALVSVRTDEGMVAYDAEDLLLAAGLDLCALCDATQTDLVVVLAESLRVTEVPPARDTEPCFEMFDEMAGLMGDEVAA